MDIQVFISRANARRLINYFNLTDESFDSLLPSEKLLELWSRHNFELQDMLKFQALKYNFSMFPDILINKINEELGKQRSNRSVFVDKRPRFHSDRDCEFLNSDYFNIPIPVQIESKDVERYRIWFHEVYGKSRSEIRANLADDELRLLHIREWGCKPLDLFEKRQSGLTSVNGNEGILDEFYSFLQRKGENDYRFYLVLLHEATMSGFISSDSNSTFNELSYKQFLRKVGGNAHLFDIQFYIESCMEISNIKSKLMEQIYLDIFDNGVFSMLKSDLLKLGFLQCANCYGH